MAKTVAKSDTAAAEVLRDLEALPPDYKLSHEEFLAFVRRLPKVTGGPHAADIIRELRGALPDDDVEDQHDRRG